MIKSENIYGTNFIHKTICVLTNCENQNILENNRYSIRIFLWPSLDSERDTNNVFFFLHKNSAPLIFTIANCIYTVGTFSIFSTVFLSMKKNYGKFS